MLHCPACHSEMATEHFPTHYGHMGDTELDLCHRCNAIWFDKMEHLALSPSGVIQLLKLMQDRHTGDRAVLPQRLDCTRCGGALRRSRRLAKQVPYEVFECPAGHGHFITYYEFLREKNMVRPLGGQKLRDLRRHVKQVNCSNCGAPIDLSLGTGCQHCKAPLAILDADAMTDTLTRLASEAERKSSPDAGQIQVQLMMDKLSTESVYKAMDAKYGQRHHTGTSLSGDLLFDMAGGLIAWLFR